MSRRNTYFDNFRVVIILLILILLYLYFSIIGDIIVVGFLSEAFGSLSPVEIDLMNIDWSSEETNYLIVLVSLIVVPLFYYGRKFVMNRRRVGMYRRYMEVAFDLINEETEE